MSFVLIWRWCRMITVKLRLKQFRDCSWLKNLEMTLIRVYTLLNSRMPRFCRTFRNNETSTRRKWMSKQVSKSKWEIISTNLKITWNSSDLTSKQNRAPIRLLSSNSKKFSNTSSTCFPPKSIRSTCPQDEKMKFKLRDRISNKWRTKRRRAITCWRTSSDKYQA